MSNRDKRCAMRLRSLALVAVGVLLMAASADASGPIGPLSGANGCIAQPSSASGTSSSPTPACAKSKGLTGANALAVSPDGKNVYVAAGVSSTGSSPGYGAVSTLTRDPASGGLTESGCLSSDATDGREGANGACASGAGLLHADAIAVSPDGANVYAATSVSGSILGFARDQASGKITRLGCFQEQPPPGSPCIAAHVFGGSDAVAVAPDGKSAYTGSSRRNAVSSLLANLTTPSGGGTNSSVAAVFAQAQPTTGFNNPCVATAGLDGACQIGTSTQGVSSLALSPDGKNLYAAATGSGAIDVFARDSAGNLTQSGCLMANAPQGPCVAAKLLASPTNMAISLDGKNLYVHDGARLVILGRDPAAGTLSEVGCLDELGLPPPPSSSSSSSSSSSRVHAKRSQTSSGSCTSVPGLDSIGAVAVSPDGSTVYSVGNGALAVFTRDPATGELTETSCDVNSDSRCSPIPSLNGVGDAQVSPDGRNVYVTASSSNGVFAFGPGATASAAQARLGRGGAAVTLTCPAAMRTTWPAACGWLASRTSGGPPGVPPERSPERSRPSAPPPASGSPPAAAASSRCRSRRPFGAPPGAVGECGCSPWPRPTPALAAP